MANNKRENQMPRFTVIPVPNTNVWTIADNGKAIPHAGLFGSAAAAVKGLESDPLGRFSEKKS